MTVCAPTMGYTLGIFPSRGGLTTGSEGLTNNEVPCTTVLSVSGFLVIPALFPLWLGFILGLIYLLNNLRFLSLMWYSCQTRLSQAE